MTTDELLNARIRASAPRYDDSDWRDVRRRARRKAAPAAVVAAAILTALLAAPAFAFRHQIADLWSTAEPEQNLYVYAFARCGQGAFALEFHPRRGAVVRQGGQVLARASLADREIECAAHIESVKSAPDESPYHGELRGRSDESVIVRCRTDAPLEVVVNPIWLRYDIIGSALLVVERNTKRAIASASLNRDPSGGRIWSQAHWDARVCSPRG